MTLLDSEDRWGWELLEQSRKYLVTTLNQKMLLSPDSGGWIPVSSFYNYTSQTILVAGEQVRAEHFCGESVTENISG